MPNFSRDRVMRGQASRRYTSRYLGKRVAKEDSSVKVPPALSVGVKGSIWELLVLFWLGECDYSLPSTCLYHLYPMVSLFCAWKASWLLVVG